MGFFDWLGNAVGGVWNGIKNVASNIYSGVKSGVNWVADKVKPIVEGIGSVAKYIPVIGAPISGLANQVSTGIGMAQKGLDYVGKVGSTVGNVVDRAFSRK
jgi:phage-related protein